MANNNNRKNLNVPNLRFPEFEGEWEEKTLGKCAINPLDYGMNAAAVGYDGENKYIRITDIDENSSRYISDSPVSPAGELSDKYIVKANDILFARTGASTGKAYLYREEDGRLYFAGFLIRAKIKSDYNSIFIFAQTQTPKYHKWIQFMSIRSGQPGINSQEYASYKFFVPQKGEQDKIATLLSLIDDRISTQNKIIEKYESLIKGLIQTLVVGNRIGWKKQYLRNILIERKEQNDKSYPIYSVAVRKGVVNQIEHLGRSFAAKNTSNYNVVRYGDIIYTKSPTGNFPYGIIKQSFVEHPVAVSPLYGVYTPVNICLGNILHHFFNSPINANNYLHSLIQKGAKNTINITNQRFLDKELFLPTDKKEIEKIHCLFSAIQKKIDVENDNKDLLVKQKKYLLSQMFI